MTDCLVSDDELAASCRQNYINTFYAVYLCLNEKCDGSISKPKYSTFSIENPRCSAYVKKVLHEFTISVTTDLTAFAYVITAFDRRVCTAEHKKLPNDRICNEIARSDMEKQKLDLFLPK